MLYVLFELVYQVIMTSTFYKLYYFKEMKEECGPPDEYCEKFECYPQNPNLCVACWNSTASDQAYYLRPDGFCERELFYCQTQSDENVCV